MKKNNFVPEELTVIGRTSSAYGVYGWIKIISFTEEKISILKYKPWVISQNRKLCYLSVDKWRTLNKVLVVKFKAIENRESAKLVANFNIFTKLSSFPKLNNKEYYWKDILGCTVFNNTNNILGKVVNIIETGSNDVLVVECKKQNIKRKQYFIPFIYGNVIKNVNIKNNSIQIIWNTKF